MMYDRYITKKIYESETVAIYAIFLEKYKGFCKEVTKVKELVVWKTDRMLNDEIP